MNIEVMLLIVILSASHFFYMRQIQKLVDKVMSRNFFEYNQSIAQSKPVKPPKFNGELSDQGPDDIGIMEEFS